MIYVTQSMMRELVSTFGVWPLRGRFIVIPDPVSYEFIYPSMLEWSRN